MRLKISLLARHCQISSQVYEMVKYKPELLFTRLLLTHEEQTTSKTIHGSPCRVSTQTTFYRGYRQNREEGFHLKEHTTCTNSRFLSRTQFCSEQHFNQHCQGHVRLRTQLLPFQWKRKWCLFLSQKSVNCLADFQKNLLLCFFCIHLHSRQKNNSFD